jgi:hypothetical protein
MNASILVAVISVAIMVLARLVMGGLAFLSGRVPIASITIPIGLGILILVGIILGQRLAWQWGRLLGLFGGIVLSLAAFGALARAGEAPGLVIVGVLLLMQGVPLFPMFFALGTQGARRHFRLICPQCGSSKPRGGNFLFTKAICRDCGTSWD